MNAPKPLSIANPGRHISLILLVDFLFRFLLGRRSRKDILSAMFTLGIVTLLSRALINGPAVYRAKRWELPT